MKPCRSKPKSRRDKWLELQGERATINAAAPRMDGPFDMLTAWNLAHRILEIDKEQARIEREARKAGEAWLECRGW